MFCHMIGSEVHFNTFSGFISRPSRWVVLWGHLWAAMGASSAGTGYPMELRLQLIGPLWTVCRLLEHLVGCHAVPGASVGGPVA